MNAAQDRFANEWQEAARPATAPAIQFLSACELKVKPISWLVDGYIEEDTLALVYGRPGEGKTFYALDVSCCIASNTDFHGHDVQSGAVFYIAGEGHNGIARRLRAWATFNKRPMPPLLFVSDAPADLANATNAARVADAIELLADATGQKPALIVIDTMARNFGGEENSATDVGHFVRNVDAIRRRWKSTVLIVHHSGKNGDNGARGSSALRAAVDAEYEVSRNAEDKTIRVIPRKMKDAEEPEPLAFDLVGIPIYDDAGASMGGAALRLKEYTAVPEPVVAKLGKHQKAALSLLERMHSEISERLASQGREDHAVLIQLDGWRLECEAGGIPRQRFHDSKQSLVERNHIRIDGPHVFLVRPVLSHLGTPDRTDKPSDPISGQTGHEPDNYRTGAGHTPNLDESAEDRQIIPKAATEKSGGLQEKVAVFGTDVAVFEADEDDGEDV